MAERMPWAEAVARFGEGTLKAGHSHQRVSNWRRDGVPGSVLLPFFKKAMDDLRPVAETKPLSWDAML